MSHTEFEEMACNFETNCINIWNNLEYKGMNVDITSGSTFTIDPNDPAISGGWNFNVVFEQINGPSYADPESRTIHINESTYYEDGNVAAHEYGHLLGLSDRYVDGGIFPETSTAKFIRSTLPITSPITESDTDYDYLNNLYSGGNSLVTPYQLDIVFNLQNETNWAMGYRWFAFGKRVSDVSWGGSNSPIFDGVSIDDFQFSLRYERVSQSNSNKLNTFMKDGNLGFFNRNFTRSSEGLMGKKNHSSMSKIHAKVWRTN
jgi:hypothetical protein